MFINIITPCSRPNNLLKIADSINIPRENYRWIIVFDADFVPEQVPDIAECYAHKHPTSMVGNAQRNYALSLINDGHIYFNDDDTIIHPELWDNIKSLDENDLISFKQNWSNGKLRLEGTSITLNNIDSHNFITHISLVGNTRWVLNRYDADGLFAHECWKKCKNYIYIPKVLSIYNSLK